MDTRLYETFLCWVNYEGGDKKAVFRHHEDFLFEENVHGPAMSDFEITEDNIIPELKMLSETDIEARMHHADIFGFYEEDVAIMQEAIDNPNRVFVPLDALSTPELV